MRKPVESAESLSCFSVAIFLGAHIPLALLMYKVNFVSTAHALVTFGLALSWAAAKEKTERVAYAAAYIAGAEVLWRMTQAQIFWEFGKYATVALFAVALLQNRRLKHRPLPILYFVILIPSVLLTVAGLDFSEAKDKVSFNLSGPLALAVSVFYFSHLKLSRKQLQRLFVHLMGPALGVASIAIYSTVTATNLVFTSESNFVTSGGYGPNQVASILGLAALMAFLYAMDDSAVRQVKIVMFGATVVFLAQSVMTFSRGGMYNAVGAAMLGSLYLFRKSRLRHELISGSVVFLLISYFILLPRLDTFTDGKLSDRLQDIEATGRGTIMLEELELWKENPILGVGPGMAKSARTLHNKAVAAHTEFSRLVAEHGTLGLFAILLLALIGVRNLRQAHTTQHKALVTAMVVWSCLYMTNAAMRLVAPAFVFGLGSVILLDRRILNRRLRVGRFHAYGARMRVLPAQGKTSAL